MDTALFMEVEVCDFIGARALSMLPVSEGPTSAVKLPVDIQAARTRQRNNILLVDGSKAVRQWSSSVAT